MISSAHIPRKISERRNISSQQKPQEDERTIPFLRRLVDMIRENEDAVRFIPGSVKGGKRILGRIHVQDRLYVETKILPRYFNHSSFASLRRQLNYFAFQRLGKGRQKGATYCNEGVIVLGDILRLRRRSHSEEIDVNKITSVASKKHQPSSIHSMKKDENVSPNIVLRPLKKPFFPKSPVQDMQSRRPVIVLDLTAAASITTKTPLRLEESAKLADVDVLAGCRALLSFSRSPCLGGLVV